MLSNSDQLFVMNTILLECSINENVSLDDIKIFFSKKSGNWYIISKALNTEGKPVKVYFKKNISTF